MICRFETYIGNIKIDWKQKKYIGNNAFRLETKFVDWKQNSQIRKSELRLGTQIVDWKQIRLETY